jgi:DNA-binding response OmpR family regulator
MPCQATPPIVAPMQGTPSRRARLVLVAAVDVDVPTFEVALPGTTIVTATPDELGRFLVERLPDAIVLEDPDAERALRSVGAAAAMKVPLLLITESGAEATRLRALEAGAEEAIAGPVSISELAGRVRLVLRRHHHRRDAPILIGDRLELDVQGRRLWRDGRWIHLRPKEALLLAVLARARGQVLTRQQILTRCWGPDHDGDPRTVDVHVRWLRAKIEPDPRAPVRLLTVRGVGYRLDPTR